MVETTEDKKKYKLTHKQVDKTVDSPCIQICTYDEEEEFCIGCYRTKQELQDWWIMTREQKPRFKLLFTARENTPTVCLYKRFDSVRLLSLQHL